MPERKPAAVNPRPPAFGPVDLSTRDKAAAAARRAWYRITSDFDGQDWLLLPGDEREVWRRVADTVLSVRLADVSDEIARRVDDIDRRVVALDAELDKRLEQLAAEVRAKKTRGKR